MDKQEVTKFNLTINEATRDGVKLSWSSSTEAGRKVCSELSSLLIGKIKDKGIEVKVTSGEGMY